MKNSLLILITLVALPLVSFAAAPTKPPTTTPSVSAPGGTAIAGGPQMTSTVITTSGAYYLASDLVMTADVTGIVINAPDVTLDLNGCTLRFEGGTTANGIEIPAVSNIEIRNGSINDVPADAIKAVGGIGLRIIDVRVTTAGNIGINSTAGLTTVDRCSVSYCGQDGISIFYSVNGAQVKNSHSVQNGRYGIFVGGSGASEISGCRVERNQRSGIFTNGEGSLVADNVVHLNNKSKSVDNGGIVIGAWSTARGNAVSTNYINGIVMDDNGCTVEGNTILLTFNAAGNGNLGNAITLDYGSGAYMNNRISPSTNAIVGSPVNGGGNVLY